MEDNPNQINLTVAPDTCTRKKRGKTSSQMTRNESTPSPPNSARPPLPSNFQEDTVAYWFDLSPDFIQLLLGHL